jgi:hypothetical protein
MPADVLDQIGTNTAQECPLTRFAAECREIKAAAGPARRVIK